MQDHGEGGAPQESSGRQTCWHGQGPLVGDPPVAQVQHGHVGLRLPATTAGVASGVPRTATAFGLKAPCTPSDGSLLWSLSAQLSLQAV